MVFNGGRVYVGNGDGTVMAIDRRTGQEIWTKIVHRTGVTCMVYDSWSDRIISGDADGAMVSTSCWARREKWDIDAHDGRILHMAIDVARDRVISGGEDGVLKGHSALSGGQRWYRDIGAVRCITMDRFRGLTFAVGAARKVWAIDNEVL
jgi:WD40 repeat protein